MSLEKLKILMLKSLKENKISILETKRQDMVILSILTDVHDSCSFFEQIDEVEHNDKPMSINQAKKMYNSLKSDDDINMVVKPNGAWMIEVF